MSFEIHQIRGGNDNTYYLAGDPDRRVGVLIDPFDGETALQAVESIGWSVQAIVNTHGHWDHVGGNDALRERYGVPIYAHPLEEVSHSLPIGTEITLGTSVFEVLHTPGHRPGHVCLLGEESLFTGDTVFAAGSGNPRFGGNIDHLFESFQLIGALPDSLWLYPGHNYALRNLAFSLHWEPGNPEIDDGLEHFRRQEHLGEPHRTKLADEKRWNLFFRLHSPALRNRLRAEGYIDENADDREVFRALRTLRNAF